MLKKTKRTSPRVLNFEHLLLSLGLYKTFHGTALMKCKTQYIQLKCLRCPSHRRTYCSCTPGTMLCQKCFQQRLLEQ